MRDHNIKRVNCFCTENEGSGNLAAVVMDFNGQDAEKLSLTRELNYPVTVFIAQPGSTEYVLDFFYPQGKMPLCLHGTLAATSILSIENNKHQLEFKIDNGDSLLARSTSKNEFQVKVTTQATTQPFLPVSLIEKMLNISSSDINHTPTVASVGSPKLLISLESTTKLQTLEPNFDLIKQWCNEQKINGLYVYTKAPNNTYEARGFNPKTGHNEDAATGVAAAALASMKKHDIHVHQGHYMNKPCVIHVTYTSDDEIWVGGMVAPLE